GLYYTLLSRGAMRTVVSDEQIQQAISMPPTTTRAWTRGRLIDRFGAHLAGVSWESVLVRPFRQGPLQRFHLLEPLAATAKDINGLFAAGKPRLSLDDTPANRPELAQLHKQLQPYR